MVSALGFGLVGLGAANIVPVLFSAGARTPGVASGVGVSAVATLGYSGFLVFPPILGFAADLFGLSAAIGIVLLMSVLMAWLGAGRTCRGRTSSLKRKGRPAPPCPSRTFAPAFPVMRFATALPVPFPPPAGQYQVLELGTEEVADRRGHRVRAAAAGERIVDDVAGIVDEIGVIACETAHEVRPTRAVDLVGIAVAGDGIGTGIAGSG